MKFDPGGKKKNNYDDVFYEYMSKLAKSIVVGFFNEEYNNEKFLSFKDLVEEMKEKNKLFKSCKFISNSLKNE